MSQRITKEDREIIAKACPKFNRICACYVNNPDYGVQLSSKAKRALNTAKNGDKCKAKSNVASVRLTKEELKAISNHGSITEAIRDAIRTVYMNDP